MGTSVVFANPKDGEPDDTCEPCLAIREGRALDVVELDAASNNRVDDMRELLPRSLFATEPELFRMNEARDGFGQHDVPGGYLRAVDRSVCEPCARKVRVGANSPSLWPTIDSEM